MTRNASRLSAAALSVGASISLYAPAAADAQGIDPATGLRASDLANTVPANANPSTAAFNAFNHEFASNTVRWMDSHYGWPATEVDGMISTRRYDQALQQLRRSVHGPRKDKGRLDPLLIKWFVLSDRFPKARQALVELRNQDAGELSGGRGSLDLFTEVNSINGYLQQQDATLHRDETVCELFKRIRERNKPLAAQCYPEAESWLVQEGDYQLCLDYIGSPQARFESLRGTFEKQIKMLPLQQEAQSRSQQHLEAMLSQARQTEQEYQSKAQQRQEELEKSRPVSPGVRYAPVPRPTRPALARPPASVELGPVVTNYFVGKVCELVEVLAGTGHRADAEQIRDQAVSALDHRRLHSALSDAEQRIQQRSLRSGNE